MEARQNTLTITGLRTEFLTPEGPLAAVDGVDLAIPRGSIVGLVGESGCGKSVTALSVLGLVPPPAGLPPGRSALERRTCGPWGRGRCGNSGATGSP